MKRFFILFAFVTFSGSAEARKVCGVEVGNTRVSLMSEACNPVNPDYVINMATHPGHSARKCVHNGKTVVVAIAPRYFVIIDFTTPSSFKVCQGKKIYK